MKPQITDSLKRATDSFAALPNLSKDGKRAFVIYQINVNDVIQTAAELFNVVNEKLVSIATYQLPQGTPFPSISSGSADSNFALFALVQDNLKEGVDGAFQVNTLAYDGTPVLKVVKSITVAAYVIGYTAYGATFVNDDKNIVVTAVTTNALAPGGNQTSTIWLLSRDLAVLDSKTAVGIYTSYANGFKISGANYFSITTGQGSLDFNNVTKAWKGPFSLRVYRVDGGKFSLVSEAPLPMGSLYGSVLTCRGTAFISVGTYAALKSLEIPSILVPTDETSEFGSNLSTLSTSSGELRSYEFDGASLSLRSSNDYDTNVENAYATSQYRLVSLGTGPYSTFAPSVFSFEARSCSSRRYLFVSGSTPLFASSADSKTLLVTTSDSQNTYNNNIILMKVQ